MVVLKKILVATDFSETSEAALNYGRELAHTFGATLHVLHIVENIVSRYATELAFLDFPEAQIQLEESAKTKLDAVITDDDRRRCGAQVALRTSAAPAPAIVDYAAREGIDLIVLGTHGRGALGHFLLGSVAERVVRTAPCPVLTVRSPEREFVIPDALVAVARA